MSLESDPATTEPAAEVSSAEPEPVVDESEAVVETPARSAEPTPPAVGTNRGLKLAVAALAALSFALAIVAATVSASGRDDGREASVRRVAGAFGTAILTYDYKQVDAWKRSVTRLSTGVFKKQFDDYSAGLGAIFVDRKNSSEVQDVEIFINDVDDKAATAILVVETTTSGLAGGGRRVTAYLQVDLVNTGNGWLVDGLTNLNLGASPVGSSASTSTTATGRR